MMSIRRVGFKSAGVPISADDIVEFHAARVLLLLAFCGISGRRIEGLTKFAKLDFFARYPQFFEVAKSSSGLGAKSDSHEESDAQVESAMVRHHYGPWDKRYYQILAHLEARQLISITKEKNTYRIALTDDGAVRAARLAEQPSFRTLVDRMKEIKKVFGSKNGSYLKSLIYRLFDEEIGQKRLGEVIEQ